MTTIIARICPRRDTAANFTSANPVLSVGELARETDTGKVKFGDGATAYNSLAYWNAGGVASFNGRTGTVALTYSDVTGALGFTPTTVSGAVAGVAAAVTGIIKSNGSALSAAVAGTDFVAPGPANASGLTSATARLLGRTTAGTGAVEEISVGSGLLLSGGTLSATGGTISLAGLGSRNYVAGTELMLIEDAGAQYQIPASTVVGSSFAMQQAARTLTNTTALQRIFDGSATGTLTLPSGTYVFEGMLYLTGMSATSGNFGFDLRGAGSATLSGSRLLAQVLGVDNNAALAPLAQNGTWISGLSGWGAVAPVLTATTGTVAVARLHGAFDTGGGTITPSIALQTATAAAQVQMGSFILIRRVAPNATATVGNWS